MTARTLARPAARQSLLGGLLCAFLCFAATAQAATYDPDLTWRTIKTEHFRIHFHQGEEQLADEFSAKVEDVYATMVDEMRWIPKRRTEIVLIDRTDVANGYAMTVPYNAIVIYVTGPQEDSTLSLYEDWLTGIQTHEFTHILHIDTNHGLARVVRAVVGRVSTSNRVSPGWMVEGMATFQETRQSATGRGRTPQVDMIKRTAVIEDDFPPLGNMDGWQRDPPAGNLRYLFGQDFMQWVADNYGYDVWTRWIHIYGGSVPYFLPGKAIIGDGFQKMYNRWRDELELRYAEQVARIQEDGPITQVRRISTGRANCQAPSFSPDGDKLVWSCADRHTGNAIWMSDGQGQEPEVLLPRRGAKNFTWRVDSQAFVYAGSHVVNRFNTWSDIYMHTLGSKSTTMLTAGARARDPAFSPDGSRLLVVTNHAQNNQLETMTVDRRRVPLTEHTDHTQYSTPRYSPDGQAVAVSIWQAGRRDIWIVAPDGRPRRRITADAAIDRDPTWSADGRTLYFTSDRSGVPNVYAVDIATERLWQVTNVLTGAVNPSISPDETLLAFQLYTHDGWHVHLTDIDRAQWIDRGTLPRPLRHGVALAELTDPVDSPVLPDDDAIAWVGEPLHKRSRGVPTDPLPFAANFQSQADSTDSFDQAIVADVHGEEVDYPFRIKPQRYTPFNTLLPRYWLPTIQTTPYAPQAPWDKFCLPAIAQTGLECRPISLVVGAVSSASDPLRHYGWRASINYRTDSNFVGAATSFTLNRWIPVYSVGFRRQAVPNVYLYSVDPTDPIDDDGNPNLVTDQLRYWEKRHDIYASMSYPYTRRTSFFARYTFSIRDSLVDLPSDVYWPYVPVRGFLGTLQGGWRYSWGRPTTYAISPERARIFSLVGSLRLPWIGSWVEQPDGTKEPLYQAQITAELREYVVNPWVPNHVLAMRMATGITFGANQFLGNYQLGGNYGDSAFYVTPDEYRMLRGYLPSAAVGDMYWLAGLEYRFPIWRMDRGFGVIPAFLRNLHARVFIDAGSAFTAPNNPEDIFADTLVGVGAEVHLSAIVLWSSTMTLRMGWAVGLTPSGIKPTYVDINGIRRFDPRQFYLRFGGSF